MKSERASKEIERRFLVVPCSPKTLFKRLQIPYRKIPIEQFYLKRSPKRVHRMRKIGNRYIETIKRGEGLVREEIERPIRRSAYRKAKKAIDSSHIIRKVRYVFEYGGIVYELDRFLEPLKPLSILEVEFPDRERAEAFSLPEEIGCAIIQEITGIGIFSNAALSLQMRIPPLPIDLHTLLTRYDTLPVQRFLSASAGIRYEPWIRASLGLKAALYGTNLTIRHTRTALLEGDDDPERIHQMRVALRKMRTLIENFAWLLDKNKYRWFREAGKTLMRYTAQARDIDVFLENLDRFFRVGKIPNTGYRSLLSHLRPLRQEAYDNLRKILHHESVRSLMGSLDAFCLQAERGIVTANDTPLLLALDRIVHKRRQTLHKHYKAVLRSPRDVRRYHKLRIAVKELRYVLEAFPSVLDPESTPRFLKKLKSLQTLLGEHHDLSVQCQELEEIGRLDDSIFGQELDPLLQRLARDQRKLEKRSLLVAHKLIRKKRAYKRLICRCTAKKK
ncbi:CHAD domain-containing protein [Nitratifractor sp.]